MKLSNILKILVALMMITSTMVGLSLFSAPVGAELGPGDVTVQSDQNSKSGRPLEQVQFIITYTNSEDNTNGEDAYLANFTITPSFPASSTDWNASLSYSGSRLYVPRGNGKGTATLYVRVAKTATHQEFKQITVKCNVQDKAGNVKDTALAVTVRVDVSQKWSLTLKNLTGDPDTKKPGSNGRVFFNMTVNNTGNGEDTVSFTATGSPGDAPSFTPFTSNDIPAFVGRNFRMSISNIPSDISRGDHVVTVTVRSENTSVIAQYDFIVSVAAYYEMELDLNETTTTKTVQPGSDVQFNFIIWNRGNGKENLNIVTGIVSNPKYWNTNVYPFSGVTVAKNKYKDIRITITAPNNDTYPHNVNVFLNVSSQNNPSVYQYTTVQVKLAQIRDVDIVAPSSKNLNTTTMKVSFPITVQNQGNGQDTFEFSVTGSFPSGELWTYDFSPNSITLDSKYGVKKQGIVYLNLTAPEDAAYGSFKVTVNSYSSAEPSVRDSKNITIVVGKLRSIALFRLVNEKQSSFPGDNVSIKFQGENVGNYADTFYLSMEGPPKTANWNFKFEPGLFADLQPDKTKIGYLNISVDKDATQGFYIINVRAESATDKSKFDTFKVNITVKRKYEIELSSTSTTEATTPGKPATFQFTVRNRGTGAANVTMDKTMSQEISAYMNVKITPKTFFLSSATDTQVIYVNITPSSSNPLAGMNINPGYPITITADIDERDGGPEESELVHVKVNQTYNVQVWPDALEKTVKPGKNVTFTLEIRNTGNGNDSFSIKVGSVIATWSAVLSSSNTKALGQDQAEMITLTLSIPINEGIDHDNVTINVSSRNSETKGLIVYTKQQVTVNVRSPVTGLNMSMTDGTRSKNVDPGKKVIFNVTATNTGVDIDRFTFEVDFTNKDYVKEWTSTASQTDLLDPEETFDLQLTFDLKSDAASDFVNITLKGTSKNNVNTVENFLMTIRINPIFDLEISYGFTGQPRQGEDALPGQNATFNIRVVNEGTSTDLVELEVEESYADISTLLAEDTFYLGASISRTILLTVIIPDEPNTVENLMIRVIATSKKDDSTPAESDYVDINFNIDPPRDVDISAVESNLEISPNLEGTKAEIDYAITVTNKGRDRDSFKITVIVDSSYASWFSHVSETPKIDEDTSTTVTVTVEIPNGAMPQVIDFDVKATSVANTAKSDQESFTLKILESYGLNLLAVDSVDSKSLDDEDVKSIGNDRVVEFNLDVINIGTGANNYKLELVENTYLSWVTISPADILNLPEGQDQIVIVTVKVPKDEGIGDIKLTIKATSRGDDTSYDTSDATDSIELWVTVTQIYDVYAPNPTTTKDGKSGQLVQFKFTLKNRGNGEDSVLLRLEDKGDWPWTLSTTALSLQPSGSEGDTKDITLSVVIPSDAEVKPGGYTVNLTVTSDTPEGDVVHVDRGDLTFKVNLEQKYTMKMTVTKNKLDGDPGDTVGFRINLRNNGNGYDTFDLSYTLEKSKEGILPEFDARLSQDVATLPPFEYTYIWLNVTIPDLDDVSDLNDIFADTYAISVHAESRGDEVTYTLNLNVTINEEYLLVVEGDTDAPQGSPLEVDADDPDGVSFFITVTNLGNDDDDIEMDVSDEPKGWNYDFKVDKVLKDSFKLEPGESKKVEVIVTFDEDAVGTTDYLDVIAESDGAKKNFRLASSDRVYIKVKVYALAIDSITLSDDPEVDTTVTITVNIRNSGEGDAEDVTVKFKIGTTQKSVTVDKIEAGTTGTAKYDWKVTDGEHKIEIEVEQYDGTMIKDDLTVTAQKDFISPEMVPYLIGGLVVLIIIIALIAAVMGRRRRELPPDIKAELAKLRKESELRKGRSAAADFDREDIGEGMLGAGAAGATALPSAGKFKELPPAQLEEQEMPKKEVKIKCPKCDRIQVVPSDKRPIEFGCSDCGQKLVLKK